MWLPMHHSLSRNRTYDKLRAGKLGNIRLFTVDQNEQPDGSMELTGFDPMVGAPNKAYDGSATNYPGGGWLLPSVGTYPSGPTHGGDGWFNATVDTFSAACWHFAEGLTELAEAAEGEAGVVPYGLLSSSWGGTVVEVWTPNATLQRAACAYPGGNATHDWSGQPFGPRAGGSLFNGMVAPYVHFSIRGALWYQVRKRLFERLF